MTRDSGGRAGAARPPRAWALAALAALAALLLGGCGATGHGASPAGPVTVPVPEPSVSVIAPSGTAEPAPVVIPSGATSAAVARDTYCMTSDPPRSTMPPPGEMPAGSTMREIQDRGYLIAGVDQDSYDWGYPNPDPSPDPTPGDQDGQAYLGFDIDLLHALAYAIFGDPDRIRFVPVTQDYRMGAANQGFVDVVADSITITCTRAEQVNFSADYFNAAQELLVPQGNTSISVTVGANHIPVIKGLTHEKVCTINTTTSVTNLLPLAGHDKFRIVLAGNWSDCLVLLQQNQVQAVSTDDTILGGLEAEDPYLKLAGQPFSFEPHGLAFPLSDPATPDKNAQFISFANGVIRQLESGTTGWCPERVLPSDKSCWEAMYNKWAGPQLGAAPSPPVSLYTQPTTAG
jgi:polar amino acid transport system substrate-binding protein